LSDSSYLTPTVALVNTHQAEVKRGERFQFGANWTRFLTHLNDTRIAQAQASLCEFLGVTDLKGKRFLDAGSGSGLFSLAARKLGAEVHSFDYDAQSVACTTELKARYFRNDPQWTVEEASVLDPEYLNRLGEFDVVYSWGVLHHTGAMWDGLQNVTHRVRPGGKLFVAIYNDQGWISKYWYAAKRAYVSNPFMRQLVLWLHMPYLFGVRVLVRAITRRGLLERGMSVWHDMIDWIGGYPFEVARPEGIFEFYRQQGFVLTKLKTCGARHGCNEFVFQRVQGTVPAV
jgi:2-polyprenyl-3-methyl-5-hydroxy-6-metoxy-1,4-benzoquinol methylase